MTQNVSYLSLLFILKKVDNNNLQIAKSGVVFNLPTPSNIILHSSHTILSPFLKILDKNPLGDAGAPPPQPPAQKKESPSQVPLAGESIPEIN